MKKLRAWHKLSRYLPTYSIIIFLCAMCYVLYINLGRDYLFDWDEGIYAELGRQVVVGGHWLTNHWNGATWFEKPPGISWVSALGIAIVGPSALGARILMPLFAVYTLFVVYRIGRSLTNYWATGAISAGILASFNLFLGRTRAVNADMPLLASLTTAIFFLLQNYHPFLVAFALFLGIWFKGLIGLLPLIITLPLFFSKPRAYFFKTIAYLLLLVTPWHLYSFWRYHDHFLTPYLYEQVLRRATTQIEFHFENRWYYFTYLYENLGLGVLTVTGFGALLLTYQLLVRKRAKNLRNPQLLLMILWWLVLPLGLFTLAKTRLFWYILPIYPGLALLIAYAITFFATNELTKTVINILAIGILLQGIFAATSSVEVKKVTVTPPDRIRVAMTLSDPNTPLLVLVPRSERLAEALLPATARLGSSFRYGGAPSLVYYYTGPVQFFYNVDEFNQEFARLSLSAIVATDDLPLLTSSYQILTSTPTYVGITKELYANR